MKNLRALLLSFACVCAAVPASAGETVQVRLWATAENLRLVFESDQPLEYSLHASPSAHRLELVVAVDAAATVTSNHSDDARKKSLQSAQAYVRAVRVLREDTRVKAEIDLADGIDYDILHLTPIGKKRHRLVLDITPHAPPEDPLLAFIQQLQAGEDGDKPAFFVLLDPGHGGEDPGAVSPNNNYEKDVVLQIAHKIRAEINRRPNMRAELSRANDRFIRLFERVHLSHRLDVDAFVSIHADSVKNRKARGSSVFILSDKGASSPFAKKMARQANLSDLIGGVQTSDDAVSDAALRQFSHDGKDRASRQLAEILISKISKINRMHSKRVESAGFAVLKSPSIPSVLVETAFISNPEEEKKLLSERFQQQMATAIADAVEQYRDTYHVQ